MNLKKIIVVDDDQFFRARLAKALRSRSYLALEAENKEQAINIAKVEKPDYGIIDLKIPGTTGLDIIKELLAENSQINLLMLTGYGSIATAVEAIKLGAINYLNKPANTDLILETLFSLKKAVLDKEKINSDIPTLDQVEWEHINRVVNDCSGNISKASKVLGLHRRSLQRKLCKQPNKG